MRSKGPEVGGKESEGSRKKKGTVVEESLPAYAAKDWTRNCNNYAKSEHS